MIADGLFEKFPMEAVFGMHNWPGSEVGKFAVSPGPVMASSNEFKVVITGKGGHAALPHNGIDPVPVACQMVQAFQTIITRNKKPVDAGVISVTMIHAGEATNVVPDTCELQGTVRTFTLEVLDLIEQRMQEIAEHTSAAFAHGGASSASTATTRPPSTPRRGGVRAPGDGRHRRRDNVVRRSPPWAPKTFLHAAGQAGCLLLHRQWRRRPPRHGPRRGPCTLHNPSYDFNDDLIPLGATYWVELARAWLNKPAP
jgi:metal-dependent amidase/aminoacylase/carboxypeptidase family protein